MAGAPLGIEVPSPVPRFLFDIAITVNQSDGEQRLSTLDQSTWVFSICTLYVADHCLISGN